MPNMFKSLWHYRHFVLSSIRNDLVSRFARSKLGGLWVIINPLSQVLIYALILSNILTVSDILLQICHQNRSELALKEPCGAFL
ncbi:O-antigen export system permease protein RfbD [methanotrophic endosymbiont of Bathymodiolus puteoserpentis (Logatchev)]|nr:O-antigen export system permease protein RfbD [methanotrophic endosymbiont of Bathymodiolus puteoserpentis (Logatchev)]